MRFHYFFFSYRDVLQVGPDSDTMSLRIFGELAQIGWNRTRIRYDSQNNIRTCCTKVKESITNQLRICRIQHELGTN